jgi:DNA polymerase III gamma/tau subunit
MREYFGSIAGNAQLRTRLGEDLTRGSVSHAYILEGPCGSGKSTLAVEIAMALACENRTDDAHPLPC